MSRVKKLLQILTGQHNIVEEGAGAARRVEPVLDNAADAAAAAGHKAPPGGAAKPAHADNSITPTDEELMKITRTHDGRASARKAEAGTGSQTDAAAAEAARKSQAHFVSQTGTVLSDSKKSYLSKDDLAAYKDGLAERGLLGISSQRTPNLTRKNLGDHLAAGRPITNGDYDALIHKPMMSRIPTEVPIGRFGKIALTTGTLVTAGAVALVQPFWDIYRDGKDYTGINGLQYNAKKAWGYISTDYQDGVIAKFKAGTADAMTADLASVFMEKKAEAGTKGTNMAQTEASERVARNEASAQLAVIAAANLRTDPTALDKEETQRRINHLGSGAMGILNDTQMSALADALRKSGGDTPVIVQGARADFQRAVELQTADMAPDERATVRNYLLKPAGNNPAP